MFHCLNNQRSWYREWTASVCQAWTATDASPQTKCSLYSFVKRWKTHPGQVSSWGRQFLWKIRITHTMNHYLSCTRWKGWRTLMMNRNNQTQTLTISGECIWLLLTLICSHAQSLAVGRGANENSLPCWETNKCLKSIS